MALAGSLRAHPARIAVAVIIVLGLVLPFLLPQYWLSTAVFILIAAIGALGLAVLTGRTGQISLGHAFFLGIGAYVGGYLGGDLHLTAALWIPAAGLVAGVIGGLVGPTALRLRGLYLAIVTIGLLYIGQHVFVNWPALTGGPGGRALADPTFGPLQFQNGADVLGLGLTRDGLYYYLALLLLALGMLYVRNLDHSRVGRGMAAVRDREVAAAVLGVNVARTKVTAFIVSSAMAGLSGALFGAYLGFVVPTSWSLVLSVEYVVMIVVGGMTSLWGPLLGALFVIGLPSLLQDPNIAGSLPFISSPTNPSQGFISASDAAAVMYGVLLIVCLVLEPRGVAGLVQRITTANRDRRPPAQARPLAAGGGTE